VLDGCGADPSKNESGPEYVYQVTFTQPGTVTISVSDDASVDIDVHLYEAANTNDCVARDDSTITYQVDCGTYLIVADTFVTSSGEEQSGAYDLNVDFTPSGQNCGTGPHQYNPGGKMGSPCSHPNHEDLPFCNPNLGADTCIYMSTPQDRSFCSRPCTGNSDCTDMTGGCCGDIGQNELYCLPSDLCDNPNPTDGGTDDGSLDGGLTGDGGHLLDGATNSDGSTGGDALPSDGSTNPHKSGSGGCDCRTTHAPTGWLPLLFVLGLWLKRRSRI